VNPESGVTISKISPSAAHSTVTVVGLALEVDPSAVAGDQADSQGFRATHAEGTADAVASYNILEVGGAEIIDLPFFGQYYGCDLYGFSSANSSMQSAEVYGTSGFFYAERTGTVDKIRFERRVGPNYSEGDGGTYQITVWPADPVTKAPITSGAFVARLNSYSPNADQNVNNGIPVQRDFDTTGDLVAGQPYAVVFRNIHASPNDEYFSMNAVATFAHQDETDGDPDPTPPLITNDGNPRNAWSPVLINGSTTWRPFPVVRRNNSLQWHRIGPWNIELRYTDGIWSGSNIWGSNGTVYQRTIAGANWFRQRFRVTRSTRVVDGVYLPLARVSGSGNVIVTLESGPASDTASNGFALDQQTVAGTNFTLIGSVWDWNERRMAVPGDKVSWVFVPFDDDITLTLGTIYCLRLNCSSSLSVKIQCSSRADRQTPTLSGVDGRDVSWAVWETDREVPREVWEDSRGPQVSSDSGTNWSFFAAGNAPILFRCVNS
jgi:hypothetical protein